MLGFVSSEQRNLRCAGIAIHIVSEKNHRFVTEGDVLEILYSKGDSLVGTPMKDINIALLEKIVRSNSYVANAEVYSTIGGEVHIDIHTREPIVRIFNAMNQTFYIDEKGGFMPVNASYTARVPVASGFIFNLAEQNHVPSESESNDSLLAQKTIRDVYAIASFLETDTFWNAQVEQIYVNEQFDIEIIPKVGDHRIILGDASGLQEKFNRLMLFYKEGLAKTGWNRYKTINLKYRQQVVCSRADQPVAAKKSLN